MYQCCVPEAVGLRHTFFVIPTRPRRLPFLQEIYPRPRYPMDAAGIDQLVQTVGQMTMLRRAPALNYVADTAAFLASDRAGAITGTITNVTCGLVPM